MRFLQDRVYAGAPGEQATIGTTVRDGGAVTVRLDGQITTASPVFALSLTPGDERALEIALVGANGASCVVRIATVDGGTDGDLLLCQPTDPAPVHVYRFITTSAAAIADLARAVAPALPAPAADAGRPPAPPAPPPPPAAAPPRAKAKPKPPAKKKPASKRRSK